MGLIHQLSSSLICDPNLHVRRKLKYSQKQSAEGETQTQYLPESKCLILQCQIKIVQNAKSYEICQIYTKLSNCPKNKMSFRLHKIKREDFVTENLRSKDYRSPTSIVAKPLDTISIILVLIWSKQKKESNDWCKSKFGCSIEKKRTKLSSTN